MRRKGGRDAVFVQNFTAGAQRVPLNRGYADWESGRALGAALELGPYEVRILAEV